eukprot:TRINITY_DN261_c0_g1_i2.p1 TRINITY_DN261_c0_g1~~TRINITY_DN261_c0_g1_i2.p1  ORF type:complete len:232 (-),score=62.83 TRINITY_DN261_c0_g1_i2:41-736(-)
MEGVQETKKADCEIPLESSKTKNKKFVASRVASADSYFAKNKIEEPSIVQIEEKKVKKIPKKRKTKRALEEVLQKDSPFTVKDIVYQLQSHQKISRKDPFFSSLTPQSSPISHNTNQFNAPQNAHNITNFDSFISIPFDSNDGVYSMNYDPQEFPIISFASAATNDDNQRRMPNINPEKGSFSSVYQLPWHYPYASSTMQEVNDISEGYLNDLIQVSQLRAPQVYQFPFGP